MSKWFRIKIVTLEFDSYRENIVFRTPNKRFFTQSLLLKPFSDVLEPYSPRKIMAFLFRNFKDRGLSLKIVRLTNWKVGTADSAEQFSGAPLFRFCVGWWHFL